MKNIISIVILVIVVLIAVFVIHENIDIPYSQIDAVVKQNETIKQETVIPSYMNLFDSRVRDKNISNMVGYFAQGAFAWYIPDWVPKHWEIANIKNDPGNEGMIMSPNQPVVKGSISNIVIDVKPSSETFNAVTLFENEKRNPIVIGEVLLNKHTEGGITIGMDTNTRIYHIQKENGNLMQDLYFIDGNNKTIRISFGSDRGNFPSYSTKIRDFVEGIGEIKSPQG